MKVYRGVCALGGNRGVLQEIQNMTFLAEWVALSGNSIVFLGNLFLLRVKWGVLEKPEKLKKNVSSWQNEENNYIDPGGKQVF